ncbi:MAG: nucleotidyl transferase AbiEii/AbiGii toxin family protein [Terriglobia bacterium]
MPFSEVYRNQVKLLIRALPIVAKEECFALKGGTAINFFVRDLPRLSVDIDLTYVPVHSRQESLAAINAAMGRIADGVTAVIPDAQATVTKLPAEKTVTKVLVRAGGAQVKIEVTPVLRGCVYDPELRAVSNAVQEAFGYAEMNVVSFADLYGGKIVAALDRQHPRDLFDIRDLLAKEGIDDALRCAFAVYLVSHSRPMAEVLAPTRKSISEEFIHGFEGMTADSVSLRDLSDARELLIETVVGKMPQSHRQFLVSFKRGEPDWKLLGLPAAVANLPAVQWKQQNLEKLKTGERARLVAKLEKVLLGKQS